MHHGRSQASAGAPAGGQAPPPRRRLQLRRGDGAALRLGELSPSIMGILNLTPDSFSDGGRYLDPAAAVARADAMVGEGAALIDLGAESTRPGAAAVGPEEEWRRLEPVLRALSERRLPAVLSVDTRHLRVAAQAAELGASLLNVPFPEHLLRQAPLAEVRAVLGRYDGVVLMHARGAPDTMSSLTRYAGFVEEIVAQELLAVAARLCPEDGDGATAEGPPPLRERLIFDPGLGFAKAPQDSLRLLARLPRLRALLGRPILIGASRKSFLGAVTDLPVGDRLVPSVVAAALAMERGASLLRVHDVAATHAAVRVTLALSALEERAAQAEGAP